MSDERFSNRSSIIVSLILGLAVVAGGVLLMLSSPAPASITVIPPPTTAPSSTPAPVAVYVTGRVQQPNQIVTVPNGSRVSDVIAAAGGFLPDADLSAVNQAAFVADGDQVDVPVIGTVPRATATASLTSALPINSATLEQLMSLPGVGPTLAERIIAFREANGLFESLDDLDAVDGIGPELLNQIAPLIRFDG